MKNKPSIHPSISQRSPQRASSRWLPVIGLMALALLATSAGATVNAPYDVETSDGSVIVVDAVAKGGRCTGDNRGPGTIVVEIQEIVDGSWKTLREEFIKGKRHKNFDCKKGQRIRVRILDRTRPNSAKGRFLLP